MDLQVGSMAVRTRAKMKTAVAKLNATRRTRRCSNFAEALANKEHRRKQNSVREVLTGNTAEGKAVNSNLPVRLHEPELYQ